MTSARATRSVPVADGTPDASIALMTIASFPHRYSVAIEHDQLKALPRAPIQVGPPPQFGGSAQVWGPEELLVGAVLLCVKTTFEAYAREANLEIYDWAGSATGVLDRSRAGAIFTAIRVEIEIGAGLGTETEIQEALHRIARSCIISRALAAPVEIVSRVFERALAS